MSRHSPDIEHPLSATNNPRVDNIAKRIVRYRQSSSGCFSKRINARRSPLVNASGSASSLSAMTMSAVTPFAPSWNLHDPTR